MEEEGKEIASDIPDYNTWKTAGVRNDVTG
jgi:hypothetical protein